MMQKVLHDVSARALQIHGSLGTSHEMPFVQYLTESFVLGLADGPTEVHKVTLARLLLADVEPAPTPSRHSICCACVRRRRRSSPTSCRDPAQRVSSAQQRRRPLQQMRQGGRHRLEFRTGRGLPAIVLDDQ